MKKLLALGGALLALSSSPAFAADALTGFYAGIDGGYDFTDVHAHTAGASSDGSVDGLNSGLFAGFRHDLSQQFGLGVEGGFDFLDNVKGHDAGLSYKKSYSYYVEAQPYVHLDATTLAYVGVGYQYGRYSIEGDHTGFNGIRYGVGVEHRFTPNLGLRLNVAHIDYTEKGDSALASFNPSETQTRLGVVVAF